MPLSLLEPPHELPDCGPHLLLDGPLLGSEPLLLLNESTPALVQLQHTGDIYLNALGAGTVNKTFGGLTQLLQVDHARNRTE